MRAKLEEFQAHMPLITALRNPGLRDRHWDRISTACGFPVKADEAFSVSRALQLVREPPTLPPRALPLPLARRTSVGANCAAERVACVLRAQGLPKYLVQIEEVSEYASKEYSLERTLDKMQADWSGVAFEYMAWRSTGTSILRALDDIQMLLDDQIVKTQSMRASPYIGAPSLLPARPCGRKDGRPPPTLAPPAEHFAGPFEDRVRLWEAKLLLTQEIIDEWLKCQQGWLYLEPIFGSEDIMQQMPNEGRKFKAVDQTWRHTMEWMANNPEVRALQQRRRTACFHSVAKFAQRRLSVSHSPEPPLPTARMHVLPRGTPHAPTTLSVRARAPNLQVLTVCSDPELLKSLAEANQLLEQVGLTLGLAPHAVPQSALPPRPRCFLNAPCCCC